MGARWLPKNFQLTTKQINNIVKHSALAVVAKDKLMGELIGEEIDVLHEREVSRTESLKFDEKMKKEKEKIKKN